MFFLSTDFIKGALRGEKFTTLKSIKTLGDKDILSLWELGIGNLIRSLDGEYSLSSLINSIFCRNMVKLPHHLQPYHRSTT